LEGVVWLYILGIRHFSFISGELNILFY